MACDACRKSKLRCSGGKRCRNCAKRNAVCKYSRNVIAKEILGSNVDKVDDSLKTSRDAAALETHAEKTTPNSDAEPTTSKAEQDISNLAGLRITRDYLNAAQPDSILRQESWLPDTFRPWLSTCLKRYFGRFHERWPVIHAPIFNENAETALIVGTLAIIGSWQDSTSESKKLALEIHKLILQKVMEDMVRDNTITVACL